MASRCRIRCHARAGQFADEKVITFQVVGPDGKLTDATAFAYGDSVELEGDLGASKEVSAQLKAHRLGEKGDLVAVVLPQSTFQNGNSVIVRKSDVTPIGRPSRQRKTG